MSESVSIREATWENDRELLLSVRTRVFVEEQKVPAEIEVDEFDPVSIHVRATDMDNHPVGTARLLPVPKIGRVAVLQPWRKRGVGRLLMLKLIDLAEQRGDQEITLHAQSWTVPFYETLDFVIEGDEFDEAGIPHFKMRKVV